MAKNTKKSKPVIAEPTPVPAPTKQRSSNFRPWDQRLFDTLDELSEQQGPYFRRSRNDIMNILLQDRLKDLGMWPPHSEESDP
jgi:hypothetical protein